MCFRETTVSLYHSAWRRVSEDSNLQKHRCPFRKFQIERSCSVYF